MDTLQITTNSSDITDHRKALSDHMHIWHKYTYSMHAHAMTIRGTEQRQGRQAKKRDTPQPVVSASVWTSAHIATRSVWQWRCVNGHFCTIDIIMVNRPFSGNN